MKRFALTVLFTALSSQVLANDSLIYEITVTKPAANANGSLEVLHQGAVVAALGTTSLYEAKKTASYLASVSERADGTTVSTPGAVTTGFSVSVNPVSIDAKTHAVKTVVTVDVSTLNGFKSIPSGEMDVQLPLVEPSAKMAQTVVLMPGEKSVTNMGNDGLEFTVALKH